MGATGKIVDADKISRQSQLYTEKNYWGSYSITIT